MSITVDNRNYQMRYPALSGALKIIYEYIISISAYAPKLKRQIIDRAFVQQSWKAPLVPSSLHHQQIQIQLHFLLAQIFPSFQDLRIQEKKQAAVVSFCSILH